MSPTVVKLALFGAITAVAVDFFFKPSLKNMLNL